MLPAVLTQSDSRFSTAGRRGKISFSYAFPRFLISILLLSILQFIFVGASAILLGAGEYFIPETGGFDYSLLFSMLIGAILGGYQVIMTSVILSRSYLLAEKTASQGGLVST